ncbi:MAG: hypothetical protein LBF22_01480 [Deltaproteobacteria bacterium]|nr:hypothetical protein [Deltaproteobacteria bacterium]
MKGPFFSPEKAKCDIVVAKRIPVDQAKPGQVLAEQIARHDGVLLASQGSQVTEGLLRMLVRQNIDSLVIEEEERRSKEEILAVHQEELKRIELAFAKVSEGSVLWALQKTMVFLSLQEMNNSLALLEENVSPPPNVSQAQEVTPPGPLQTSPAKLLNAPKKVK